MTKTDRRQRLLWITGGVLTHVALLLILETRWGFETLLPAHDAGFYISHLRDPLLTQEIPDWWDNVPYRGLRVGYIVLALPFRWLGEIPALMIANLIGVGVGIWAVLTIAERHGANERLAALAWIFNPGAIVCTALLLPDTIAWTAILLAILAVEKRRWVASAALGVMAVATKEASLAALAMVAVSGFRREWRASLPLLAGSAWHLFLLAVLRARVGSSFHSLFVSLPFVGWIEAWRTGWDSRPLSQIFAIAMLTLGVLIIIVWWRRRSSMYLAAAAGQALLMIGLDAVVIIPISNSLRVGGLFLPVLASTSRAHDGEDPATSTSSAAGANT